MGERLSFLKKYLNIFDQQAGPWKRPHDEVMEAYQRADDLSEAVAYGLFLLDRIEHSSEGAAGPEAAVRVTMSEAKTLCDFHEWWYANAGALLAGIDASEAAGFAVKKATEFREAHRRVGEQMHAVRKLQQSIVDFEEGRGVSLEDALHGLRRFWSPEP